jgi:trehalose-phosphatase
MPEEQIAKVLSQTLTQWSSLAEHPGLKLLHFEGGLELRITHPDKGDAVATVLKGLDENIPVAFLGDDLTDEDAFRKLSGRGLSILVRDEYRQTEAKIWLKPPQELIAFLDEWSNRIRLS